MIPKPIRLAGKKLMRLASGEFLLDSRANSGSIILARSFVASTLIFLLAIAIKTLLGPTGGFDFCAACLKAETAEHLSWYAATFGAVYAALYTRFSSQWTYLAGLYNQIMASEAQYPHGSGGSLRDSVYSAWKAGFIEDAEEVHLALKPIYAAVIAGWLGDGDVVIDYQTATVNGEARLKKLEKNLKYLLGDQFEKLKERGKKSHSQVPAATSHADLPTAEAALSIEAPPLKIDASTSEQAAPAVSTSAS